MEIELKYSIDKFKADKIFADEYIKKIMDDDSEEFIQMEAVYFDTEDRRLNRDRIALRIRKEGNITVATLKWNGSSEEGLYKREEINIPVSADSINSPTIELFSQSPMYDELYKLIGDRPLVEMMRMSFVRHQVRVDTGKAICEISVDEGSVKCAGKESPILELEIELYSGSSDALEKLGAEIADKYQLVPENRSKFKRGLDLML